MRHSPLKVAGLLFGSGLTALVYQTTWLRELRLIFGASTASSAAVLAIFMGGLGLGGLLIGRRVDRSTSPLRLYANLELAIALLVAVTPVLIHLARLVYFSTGGTFELGHPLGTTIKLLLSTAILGAPAFLMGGTLPAAARAIETSTDVNRRRMAFVYGINTLGAVTGALVTTFLLLELYGNRTTLWIACLVNLLVAMIALRMSKADDAEIEEEGPSQPPVSVISTPVAPVWFVLLAAGISGFVFFLMEIVWYRMLSPILGGSVFSFGLILAVALLGIGLGSLIYTLTLAGKRVTAVHFAFTAGLEAFFVILPFAIGDSIALATLLSGDLRFMGFGGSVALWSLTTAVVALPVSIIAGFQFPLLVALLGEGHDNIGSDIGKTYLANTIGAIAGSLAGGFGLLPLLGAPGVWQLSAVLILAIGAAAFAASPVRPGRPALVTGGVLAVSVLAMLLAEGPTAIWRHSGIGAGRARDTFADRNALVEWQMYQRRGILLEREGVESAMAVSGSSGYALLINGKSDGNAIGDAGTQIMGGLLGPLLHPAPSRVLIVGLGTGSSAGWAADAVDVVDVDVVELEPAVVEMAELSSPVNRNVIDNPDVNILFGDAREFVLTTDEFYDVIFSEPSNPYRAGVASLFTREFYQAVSSRLSEDGIFVQWLQSYEISAESVASVYATISEVFPHVQTWMSQSGDMLLVATREPLEIDTRRLAGKLTQPGYREGLRYGWGVHDPEGILARLITTEPLHELLGRADASVNTDDHNTIEFAFARSVGTPLRVSPRNLYLLRPGPPGEVIVGGYDRDLVERRILSAFAFHGSPSPAPRLSAHDEIERILGHFTSGEFDWIPVPETSIDELDITEKIAIAAGLATDGDPLASSLIRDIVRTHPVEAAILEAHYHWGADRIAPAVESLTTALEAMREYPWTNTSLIFPTLALIQEIDEAARDPELTGVFLEALARPFSASSADENRLIMRSVLTTRPWMDRCNPALIRLLEDFGTTPLWNPELLERRAACLTALNHPLARVAIDQLELHRELDPPTISNTGPPPDEDFGSDGA